MAHYLNKANTVPTLKRTAFCYHAGAWTKREPPTGIAICIQSLRLTTQLRLPALRYTTNRFALGYIGSLGK